MKNLAIITARGGSKRIPRKNIRPFLGKPLISYAINNAIESKVFDEIMVSTDDSEIAQIAEKSGAKVPFIRSDVNSNDEATTVSAMLEVIESYQKKGEYFDNVCCIYPATPLLNPIFISRAYNKLVKENLEAVFPVMEYSFPVQRALKMENQKVKYLYPDFQKVGTQSLETFYHDAGQFYWAETKSFLKNKSLMTEKTGCVILAQMEAQDIDTFEDWKLAELKFNMK